MVLLIDNYDSFSYNLYQMVGKILFDTYEADPAEADPEKLIRVIRNDEMTVEEIRALAPERIILSPGPGKPADAGICEDVVRELGGEIPILGVCLGHQAICEVFGATVTHAKRLMHGKQSVCELDADSPIFRDMEGLSQPVARYHSLAAKEETLPAELKVIARATDDDEIMAVQHVTKSIYGLQFHPESILTPAGEKMLRNFLG